MGLKEWGRIGRSGKGENELEAIRKGLEEVGSHGKEIQFAEKGLGKLTQIFCVV